MYASHFGSLRRKGCRTGFFHGDSQVRCVRDSMNEDLLVRMIVLVAEMAIRANIDNGVLRTALILNGSIDEKDLDHARVLVESLPPVEENKKILDILVSGDFNRLTDFLDRRRSGPEAPIH